MGPENSPHRVSRNSSGVGLSTRCLLVPSPIRVAAVPASLPCALVFSLISSLLRFVSSFAPGSAGQPGSAGRKRGRM
eukprot:8363080-Pyramimonas_sp.AAC.1